MENFTFIYVLKILFEILMFTLKNMSDRKYPAFYATVRLYIYEGS